MYKKIFTSYMDNCNEDTLKKLFFVLVYEGLIDNEYSFIFSKPLYCNASMTEIKREIKLLIEKEYNLNLLNKLCVKLLDYGVNSYTDSMIKKYK